MKVIRLNCQKCAKSFSRPLKEHSRQLRKNSDAKFYCSLACAGKINVKNLPSEWNTSERNINLLRSQSRIAATKYTPEDKPFREYQRRCFNRKNKSNGCDLTIEYLRDLWERQSGRCALSNIPLSHPTETRNINIMASVDRINPKEAYKQGNVQYVSCALNYAKSSKGDESVRELIKLIKDYS